MGQSHSKRFKTKRYHVEGEDPPRQKEGKRRFRRRQTPRVPLHQQIADHSHKLYQHQERQRHENEMRYKRRSSQDVLRMQMDNSAYYAYDDPPRSESWHDLRVISNMPDVSMPGRTSKAYRPNNLSRFFRRETSHLATYESDSVTTTGYFSIDRKEKYYAHDDASYAPPLPRDPTSEVTEPEIKQLAEDLGDSDWVKLGRLLGLAASRLADFKELYYGNAHLCATEVLLLWKHNSSEVRNPRKQLAMALSTIGREDLYGKIKRRVYQHTAPSPGVNGLARGGSLERDESGVETVESLSDSLEEESDIEDDLGSIDKSHTRVIIPVQIDTKDESKHTLSTKPLTPVETSDIVQVALLKSIDDAIASEIHASARRQQSAPVGHPVEVPTTYVDTGESADQDTPEPSDVREEIQDQALPDIALDALERSEANDDNEAQGVPEDAGTHVETSGNEPQVFADTESPASVEPIEAVSQREDAHEAHDQSTKEVLNASAETSKVAPHNQGNISPFFDEKAHVEITENELHVLAGEIHSPAEWRKLGQSLGVANTEMKNLSRKHHDDVTQCAFGVLGIWKKRHDYVARERHVLASVLSDVGRDDLFSALNNHTLVRRIETIATSVQRWREQLKDTYLDPDQDDVNDARTIDVGLLLTDEDGNETKLLNRHGLLKLSKERRQVVVVHGDAGSGKSNLLKRLARDWANGTCEFSKSEDSLVLHLDLQGLRTCASVGEAVVKYLLHRDAKTTAEMVDDYLRLYPDKVLLLLDGVDINQANGDLFLMGQIRRWTQCKVVVTSRAYPKESSNPTLSWLSVKVQNLNSDQRNAFINTYFEENADRRKELTDFIAADDILPALCTRPMFLDIVCNLWNHGENLHSIHTISDLLLAYLVLVFRQHGEVFSGSADSLPVSMQTTLSCLGRIALECILQPKKKLLFQASDLTGEDEKDGAEVAASVGILIGAPEQLESSSSNNSDQTKEDREWRFSSPMVHEKCAGMHLAYLQENDPETFEGVVASIRSVAEVESLKYVLMFACAGNASAAKRILKLLGDLSWKEANLTSKLTCQHMALLCNFECNQEDALNRELQFNLRSLYVASFPQTFLADAALRYFIKNSLAEAQTPIQLERVQFMIGSRLDLDYATACLQHGYFVPVPEFTFEMPKSFSPSRDSLRRLSDDVITPSLLRLQVSSILSSGDFISNLHSSDTLEELTGSDIDPKYIDVPAWCRNYPHLRSLNLSCVMFNGPGDVEDYVRNIKDLEPVICTLSKLSNLHLSNFYSSERMITLVTKALQTLRNLHEVQIGPSGEDLEHYAEDVEGACGTVSDVTMQAFIKSVKASSLKVLKLSCFGNFEKLYQLLRADASSRTRRSSGLLYTADTGEDGYWIFKR